MFFDATKSKPTPPLSRPIQEQEERESQRLWERTAKAVKERNHELATDEKTKIEDRQREEAATRAQENVEWIPRLFRAVKSAPGGPEEGEESLEWIINAHMSVKPPPTNILMKKANAPPQRSFRFPGEANRTNPGHLPHCGRPDIEPEAVYPAASLVTTGQKVHQPCSRSAQGGGQSHRFRGRRYPYTRCQEPRRD